MNSLERLQLLQLQGHEDCVGGGLHQKYFGRSNGVTAHFMGENEH
jgi:hypothetical protein